MYAKAQFNPIILSRVIKYTTYYYYYRHTDTFVKTVFSDSGGFKMYSFARFILLIIHSKFYISIQYVMYIYWTASIWFASYEISFLTSIILIIYGNFEIIFWFMALKRALICGRNVYLSLFFAFFYIYHW